MAEWNSKQSSREKGRIEMPWENYFGIRMNDYDKLCSVAVQHFNSMSDYSACRELHKLIEEYKEDAQAVNALKMAYMHSRHSTCSK